VFSREDRAKDESVDRRRGKKSFMCCRHFAVDVFSNASEERFGQQQGDVDQSVRERPSLQHQRLLVIALPCSFVRIASSRPAVMMLAPLDR